MVAVTEDCARNGTNRLYLKQRKVAAQFAVSLPELGWSVTEASMMPLLLKLQVPTELLSVCWLASPVVGLLLHPVLGHLSDRFGRGPFILLFAFIASCGLISLPVIVANLSGTSAVVAVLSVFGMVDASHDLLLTPTRAAMNDVFNPEASEWRCAMLGGMGKLTALLCVVALGGERAFTAAGIIMILAACPQLLVPWGPAPNALLDESPASSSPSVDASSAPSSAASRDSAVAAASAAGEEPEPAGRWCRFPKGFLTIWILSCTGWVAVCVVTFGTTSAFAERSGAMPGETDFDKGVKTCSVLLMGSTIVFTLVGGALPQLVRLFGGHLNTMVATLVALTISSLSFSPLCPTWFTIFCMMVLIPPSYQVVSNVPFAWLEAHDDFDSEERGRLTGWFNSSLAVAQTLTALATGPVVAWANNKVFASFVAGACLSGAIAVGAIVFRCCLFCRRRREAARSVRSDLARAMCSPEEREQRRAAEEA